MEQMIRDLSETAYGIAAVTIVILLAVLVMIILEVLGK